MRAGIICGAVFACLIASGSSFGQVAPAAATPPMGWNSWDSFGLTVTEQEYLDNAQWMAEHLRSLGWQYAVVDEGWYLPNPQAKPADFQFNLDSQGRYLPVDNRFPSAAHGAGFGPLAERVHALGLKFGIHIIRGIPKLAVMRKLAIAGSTFTADAAADVNDTCPWNADNYGLRNNAAGQAYYDSLAKLYASWGVDYLKIDCISSHPYKGEEIQMISNAIKKAGHPMVLSLSPGPAPVEKAVELNRWADLWRISDDVWDVWKVNTGKPFPQDVSGQFQRAAQWEGHAGNGHWPDADMLPLGHLGPRPGNGKERDSELNREEQKSLMTLWCIFRSPLIMGGNLTRIDPGTESLLNNPEVLAVDQRGSDAKQVAAGNNVVVWQSKAEKNGRYLAVFNLGEEPRTLDWDWKQVSMPAAKYRIRDLWTRKNLPPANKLTVAVQPHGAALFRIDN